MKNKVLITYLCYITEDNRSRRFENFKNSIKSLKKLDKNYCEVVAINNNCCDDVVKLLNESTAIDRVVNLSENYWDVAVIFLAAYLANQKNYKYSCYLYDDFVVYDSDFLKPCIDFLNNNQDTGCVRITKYDFANKHLYDSTIVPKHVNPESIRHYSNNHVSNGPLTWEGPFYVNNKVFYKNNWHYSSRPAIWKNRTLLSFFDNLEESPVMQPFEKLGAIKFFHTGLKTGVLDIGAVHTFLESERTNTSSGYGYGKTINIKRLISEVSKL